MVTDENEMNENEKLKMKSVIFIKRRSEFNSRYNSSLAKIFFWIWQIRDSYIMQN